MQKVVHVIKFKITPARISEACNILEYLNLTSNKPDKETIIRISPRFILDKEDKYIVEIGVDEDGDIKEFKNITAALLVMTGVTPKRLEKLIDEFTEAAKAIVNPQNGGDSNTPTSTVTKKPPPG